MGTLNTTMTIVSSNITTDSLSISVNDTLTTEEPTTNTARSLIAFAAATVLVANTSAVTTYVYLKNMDETNFITIKTDAAVDFARLYPGEFAFFPLEPSVGVEVQADTANCILEYGLWSRV
jgi:hypothetical protein